MKRSKILASIGAILLTGSALQAQQPGLVSDESRPLENSVSSGVAGLRLMKFNGMFKDRSGKPMTGVAGATFGIYRDAEGGAPLWLETQNVELDAEGKYVVLLGATTGKGIPMDMLASHEPRWLGAMNHANGTEEPRVMLVSVPYAITAGNAETLGGKPLSDFMLKTTTGDTKAVSAASTSGDVTPSLDSIGDNGYIAGFTASNNIRNSTIFESGTNIGIGTTSPGERLHISGGDLLLDNGAGLKWRDSGGTIRRASLWSGSNNLYFGDVDNSNNSNLFLLAGGAGQVSFFTNGSYRAGINSSGNFGVGTSTPGDRFHVSGGNFLLDNGFGLRLKDGGGTARRTSLWTPANNIYYGDIDNSNNSNLFLLSGGTGQVAFFTNGSQRANVTQTGEFGIGTPNPLERLHLSGGNFLLDNGFGLKLKDSGGTPRRTSLWTGSNNIYYGDIDNSNNANLFLLAGGAGQVAFFTNGTQKAGITPGGNLGIGTSNPSERLDVSGNIKSSGVVTGTQLVSNVSTGTPPLVISSTTMVNNLNASLVGGVSATALRTRGIVYLGGCDTCGVLADSDDQKTIYQNVIGPMTINSVTCFSNEGTPTINIKKDDGSPASIFDGGTLSCATSPTPVTVFSGSENVLSLDDKLDFEIVTAGGTAKRVTVVIKATVN